MHKKRYGILIGLTLIVWAMMGIVVWKVDPETIKNVLIPNSYLPMGVLTSLGIFLLLCVLLMSAKRAIIWTILLIVFIYLRIFQLGTIMNGLLLLGLGVVVEIYRRK